MIDEKKLIEELYKLNKSKFLRLVEFEKLINEQPKVDNWIPVSERLPKQNQTVIVTEDGEVKICTYELWYGYGYGFYGSRGNVTAWMPLPEAYEGEKK